MTKKATTQPEFEALPEERRLHLLQRDGVYIGKRTINGETIILFQLSGFYVEVYYQQYRKDVRAILTSDSPEILTPYLAQVRINDLDKDREA